VKLYTPLGWDNLGDTTPLTTCDMISKISERLFYHQRGQPAMPKKKRKQLVIPFPAPQPDADQGVILRALADLLRFVADLLTDLSRRR
jgi:hypothetical protein